MNAMHGVLGSGLMLLLGMACPGRVPRGGDPSPDVSVRPGLEVLLEDSLHLVRGQRVGLVTNQAGVDHRGRRGVDRLLRAGVRLTALFSPEHGFRGTADPGAAVGSTTDAATGLPIYSLYGATSAPPPEVLAGLDIVLVDLQDAGARYYTYLWTTTQVMRAAAGRGMPVVVLDRPNPIADAVQGGVLDTAYRSAVGLLAVPMRHGMTLGELARMANEDLRLGTDLRVVPVRGWRRSWYFDQTGLPLVPPSPNLRSLEALIHYPGLCLFEGTTLSVGRGSEHPFEQIGAPWLDTTLALRAVRQAGLPGVEFAGVTFTPRRPGDSKFADSRVNGLRLKVTDRQRYDPTRTALVLLAALARDARGTGVALFPESRAHFERLLASTQLRLYPGRLDTADGWRELTAGWSAEIAAFRDRRRPYLLYPE